MIGLQHIIDSKRELLSRETYSRNPINYSEGMADDQKDRYIQYLAEQNQDLRLTNDAMKLVLEDFMVQMKELKDQERIQKRDDDQETVNAKTANANREDEYREVPVKRDIGTTKGWMDKVGKLVQEREAIMTYERFMACLMPKA